MATAEPAAASASTATATSMAASSSSSGRPMSSSSSSTPPPSTHSASGPSSSPPQDARRTSWRQWGASMTSWASTAASPFRAGARPSSASAAAGSSPFSFASLALVKSRATEAIALPPSDVSRTLIESEDETMLQEGERLRLPPTPAELEALEAAGIKDEEDLRLEAEERELVRSMPPPPRHHSVVGKAGSGLVSSAQPSPKNELPAIPPVDKALPASPMTKTHEDQPPHGGQEEPWTATPVALARKAVPEASLPPSAAAEAAPSTPESLPPQPVEDLTTPRDLFFSGLRRAPTDRGEESESSVYESGTGSESEGDLIPSDVLADSEPEAELELEDTGVATPQTDGRRRSRSAMDRFSVLLNSLARPDEAVGDDVPDRAATPLAGGSAPKGTATAAAEDTAQSQSASPLIEEPAHKVKDASASDYAASSASEYGDTELEGEQAAATTVPSASAAGVESPSPKDRSEALPDVDTTTSEVAEGQGEPEGEATSTAGEVPVVGDADRSDASVASSSSSQASTDASRDAEEGVGMKSLGDELQEVDAASRLAASQVQPVPPTVEADGDEDNPPAQGQSREEDQTPKSSAGPMQMSTFPEPPPTEGLEALLHTEGVDAAKEPDAADEPVSATLDNAEASSDVKPEAAQEPASIADNGLTLPPSTTEQSLLSVSQSFATVPDEDAASTSERTTSAEASTVLPEPVLEGSAASLDAEDQKSSTPAQPDRDAASGKSANADSSPSPNATVTVEGAQDNVEHRTHDRLLDALGLSRPDSPAQSVKSTSSFASAMSADEEDVHEEGSKQIAQNESAEGAEDIKLAQVKIEHAEPLSLVSSPQLNGGLVTGSAGVTADKEEGQTGPRGTSSPSSPLLLGSPRAPGSPSLSAAGSSVPSSSRPISAQLSSHSHSSDGTSAAAAGESLGDEGSAPDANRTTPAGAGAQTSPANSTLSPAASLARPARSRNRKGPAPTPPSGPSSSAAAAAAAAMMSNRSSVASASDVNGDGEGREKSKDEKDGEEPVAGSTHSALDQAAPRIGNDAATAGESGQAQAQAQGHGHTTSSGVGAGAGASAGAAAVPLPSRPPRARPPKAKARAVATLGGGATSLDTASSPRSPSSLGGGGGASSNDTDGPGAGASASPRTPTGGKRKLQRKAVPRSPSAAV